MHDQIPLIASTGVIVIGLLFGILFNQRGLDRLEARMDFRFDRIQSDLNQFHRTLGQHDEAIETFKKRG